MILESSIGVAFEEPVQTTESHMQWGKTILQSMSIFHSEMLASSFAQVKIVGRHTTHA